MPITEKVVMLLCDHPTHDSSVEISWHMAMCRPVAGKCATSFAPNVSQEHQDYTDLYKVITAGSPPICISTTVSTSQSSTTVQPQRIRHHPLHYTQNIITLPPSHAGHPYTPFQSLSHWPFTLPKRLVTQKIFLKVRCEITQSEAIWTI